MPLAGQTSMQPHITHSLRRWPLCYTHSLHASAQHCVCLWKPSMVRLAVKAGMLLNFRTKVSTSRAARPCVKALGTSSITEPPPLDLRL